jgi:excisionase family DNA binding protein
VVKNTTIPAGKGPGTDPLHGRLALSVRETAEALGLCEKTVRRLIRRGQLRASTALRHLLIPRSEIIRFLEQTSQSDRQR